MTTINVPHLTPPHVLMLQALHHRLPENHERFNYIDQKVRNELSGFYGESKMLYPLRRFPTNHKILPNVRLRFYSNYFQIDFLLLSSKFLLILESKYYSDELTFDDTVHQVVQQKSQGFKVFEDPVLQAEEQAFQLSSWLESIGFSGLPIEYFVVMTNSRTRLKIDPANIHHGERVISLQRLPSLFRDLEAKYQSKVLSMKEINNLTLKISQHQQIYLPNVLKSNKINEQDLLKGVFCMNCGKLGMKMTKKRWQCSVCGHRDRTAHENALKDYFLIKGREISNQTFREFAGLESRSTARDMLKRASKNISGKSSAMKHQLPYDYQHDNFDYLMTLNKLKTVRRM